ncbi:hypothetical protein PG994_011684 [Apiospora phragmitis]|uniref:Uncharacterized protein n=1 Tax=Apiospora phragmitis TaxID=2905665 RepID=A0ABR1TW55_9PEZI
MILLPCADGRRSGLVWSTEKFIYVGRNLDTSLQSRRTWAGCGLQALLGCYWLSSALSSTNHRPFETSLVSDLAQRLNQRPKTKHHRKTIPLLSPPFGRIFAPVFDSSRCNCSQSDRADLQYLYEVLAVAGEAGGLKSETCFNQRAVVVPKDWRTPQPPRISQASEPQDLQSRSPLQLWPMAYPTRSGVVGVLADRPMAFEPLSPPTDLPGATRASSETLVPFLPFP